MYLSPRYFRQSENITRIKFENLRYHELGRRQMLNDFAILFYSTYFRVHKENKNKKRNKRWLAAAHFNVVFTRQVERWI